MHPFELQRICNLYLLYVAPLDIKICRNEDGWNPINKNKPGACPFQSIAYSSIRLCRCCFCILNYDVCQRSDSIDLFLVNNITLNHELFEINNSYFVSVIASVNFEHYPFIFLILKKTLLVFHFNFNRMSANRFVPTGEIPTKIHGRKYGTINMLYLLTWCVYPKYNISEHSVIVSSF